MYTPDISQDKMSTLMESLAFVHTYLDDLLCLCRGIFTEILLDVDHILVRFRNANLKVNVANSSFGKNEFDILGYVVSREERKNSKIYFK